MNQKDKELLLKDLSARLPYKPKALVNGHLATILGIDENVVIVCIKGNDYKDETIISANDTSDDVKPYLRPMSSMTEVEIKEYGLILCDELSINQFDWLNAHHFDYRGLIEKGLAIEAPNDMYKI